MPAARDHAPFRPPVRLIGVGNEYRRDDGVGIFIVRHPLLAQLPGVRTFEEPGEAGRLMELWKKAGTTFLFDAVCSGGIPGAIYRFDVLKEQLPADIFHHSTHRFSIAEAVALSRVLNQMPGELVVFGIEGKNFGSGPGLSLAVEEAALTVIRCMRQDILGGRVCSLKPPFTSTPNGSIGTN
jgi:hydrogenase maturation protease